MQEVILTPSTVGWRSAEAQSNATATIAQRRARSSRIIGDHSASQFRIGLINPLSNNVG